MDIFGPTAIDNILVIDTTGVVRSLFELKTTDCRSANPVKAIIWSKTPKTTITITVKFSDNPTISFFRSDVIGDEIEETHWVAKRSVNYNDHDVISVTKDDCGVIVSAGNQSIHDPNDGYEVTDLLNFVKKTVLDPIDQSYEGKTGKKDFDNLTWH